MLTKVAGPIYDWTMAAQRSLDRTFDALSNAHRRQILATLRRGPLDTPELVDGRLMSKQAHHRHVRILEDAGLVGREARGRVNRLHLIAEPLGDVTSWVREVRRGWDAGAPDLLLRTTDGSHLHG